MIDFLKALKGLHFAEVAAGEALIRDFPPATVVQWPHGRTYRVGAVVRHAPARLAILVRGIRSEFWVDGPRITHRRLLGQRWERTDGALVDPPGEGDTE